MSLKVDKGVPIPSRSRLTPVSPEDFSALEVGDSFAVPVPEQYKERPTIWAGTNRLRSAVYRYTKGSDRKFTVRCLPGEVRVWRVA